ncbi:MAG: PH domain-containing protein [Flavobacteriales bacterium]|nr:PH domain-containing protein [Flavobacteriales bacterium]
MSASFSKKYKASKKGFYKYIMWFMTLLPFILFFVDSKEFLAKPAGIVVLFAAIGLLYWLYFDTYYKIENNLLFYKTAFIKGDIDILKIKEIEAGKTLFVGYKPAIGTKGMIIRSGKFNNEIYIAPINNQEMIDDLLKINPEIIIKN